MFKFKDVTQWNQTLQIVDVPSLQFTFSGIFGHLLMLEFGYNTTLTIAEPFMGKFFSNTDLLKMIFFIKICLVLMMK